MFEVKPTLELLFEQLGLDSDQHSIEVFIQQHQLPAETLLHCADFWTEGQRQFLKSHLEKDDDWAIVIDTLNELLHS
ncbi:DUF2789 domain-containing protein [Acinetobacter sp. MD2(2019)]|uniref:DUF2789 domain-containing protein n=1 Tax=Acinetobacter sp. MD2(2019) TaxID=2605273 RepID=UPI002D1F8358|nr:DUF2789 domain-containing protein [Acinetobacter sp. MD2(2019)]MEB3752985.1 DUF2789 domain-containing protein [Acinetobacter sp. MD2(2019)]